MKEEFDKYKDVFHFVLPNISNRDLHFQSLEDDEKQILIDRLKIRWEELQKELSIKKVLDKRVKEYGTIGEQLDMIFHNGIEAWKSHIQQVKDSNPKPEEG